MRGSRKHQASEQLPQLLPQVHRIDVRLKTISEAELARIMHISPALAASTHALIAQWGTAGTPYHQALDLFSGDIYRTLRAQTLTDDQRIYANQVLRILSGQYGILRPFDLIQPYRLEIGYPLQISNYRNLYEFWGDAIAQTLQDTALIVNAASEEYFRVVKPYLKTVRVVSPLFLTAQNGTEPTFVAIHAKWARGAFAHWLVTTRTTDPTDFNAFNELGYAYDSRRSTADVPVFVRAA